MKTWIIKRNEEYLAHHGIKGQHWGVRRYQNEDGSLTDEGKNRYGNETQKAFMNSSIAKNLGRLKNAKMLNKDDINKIKNKLIKEDVFTVSAEGGTLCCSTHHDNLNNNYLACYFKKNEYPKVFKSSIAEDPLEKRKSDEIVMIKWNNK